MSSKRMLYVGVGFIAVLILALVTTSQVYAGALTSITINPGEVAGGSAATGAVTVAGCATPTCQVMETIQLTSSDPSVASVPASLVIPVFGKDPATGTFSITTFPVSSAKTVTITAQKGDEVRSAQLKVCPQAPALSGLQLDPVYVIGGSPSSLILTLECEASQSGVQVNLFSEFPNVATVPDSVVIKGEMQHTFTDTVHTTPVNFYTPVKISGEANGGVQDAKLSVLPGGQNLNLAVHKHGIEVTQAIQCFGDGICPDNSLPLVQNKTTAVRVYIELQGSSSTITNVRGKLLTRPCGSSGQWIPHPPAWNGATLTSAINDEDHLQAQRASPAFPGDPAFNLTFLVDGDYLAGGCLDFKAEINPDQTLYEIDYSDNVAQLSGVEFHHTRTLTVKFLRIKYFPGLVPLPNEPQYTPDWETSESMKEYLQKIYPVSQFEFKRHPVAVPRRAWNFNKEISWEFLLNRMRIIQVLNGDTGMHYYGLLDERVDHHGCCGGMGRYPNQKVGAGHAGHTGTGVYERSARTFAHEISHNVGRQHAPCNDPDDIDPSWPDASNPGAIIGTVGFDIQSSVALSSTIFTDIMSYCPEQWISPYTYEAVYEDFGPASTASATSPGPPGAVSQGSYLIASGVISDSQHLSLDPFLQAELPTGLYDNPGSGLYALVLRAADGSALYSRNFELARHSSAESSGAFVEVLPYDPASAKIDVIVQGIAGPITLASRMVSAHPPEVQLTYPDGGESISATDTFTATWMASDLDSDTLSFTLLFSGDGGTSWEALVTGLTETHYTLNAAELPGSDQALVRVMASDGVNTTQDESKAVFSIQQKVPQVSILTPADQDHFELGTAVLLQGRGYDTEDGQLGGSALTWTSDRDGFLDSGEEIVVTLSSGIHTLTLSAVDSHGNEASSAVRLYSGDGLHQVYLPIVAGSQ